MCVREKFETGFISASSVFDAARNIVNGLDSKDTAYARNIAINIVNNMYNAVEVII